MSFRFKKKSKQINSLVNKRTKQILKKPPPGGEEANSKELISIN